MTDTNVAMEIKETETSDEISIPKQDLLTLLNILPSWHYKRRYLLLQN